LVNLQTALLLQNPETQHMVEGHGKPKKVWVSVFEECLNLGTIFHKGSKQLLIKYAWILRFSCINTS
jgi:hypothetical protein